jgi:DNA ligase-associated metallophosphoesterase
LTINLQHEELILDAQKAIFWARRKTLLLADLHLGKAEHFRKEGIPVPMAIRVKNLKRIADLIKKYQPDTVIFLGDLFHSFYNNSWQVFSDFLKKYPKISFELVLGNHDILAEEHYETAALVLHQEPYFLAPFLLSHHPHDEVIDGFYNLYGHLHPCVFLHGKGKQIMRLPCFHFSEYHGVLPAFGEFTGMAKMETNEGDRVFITVENEVMQVYP